jgi:hypothetical protein
MCLFVISFGLQTLFWQNQKRNDTSFGVMKMHKTVEGQTDSLFEGLSDPFYAIDSGITKWYSLS